MTHPIIDNAVIGRLESLAELGEIDVADGDALLLKQRDQLEKTLAREEIPARDIVAVSAELRAVHEKLLDVAKRRRSAWGSAYGEAKVRAKMGAAPGAK